MHLNFALLAIEICIKDNSYFIKELFIDKDLFWSDLFGQIHIKIGMWLKSLLYLLTDQATQISACDKV